MRLVRVIHWRCNEPTGEHTYAFVPDGWDEGEVDRRLHTAQTAYLDALKVAHEEATPPNDARSYVGPPYKRYPDKTVREVDEAWAAQRAEYQAWEERQRQTRRRFGSFLVEQGFVPLGDGVAEDDDLELDWGHRHGTPLDYAETATDTLPTPRTAVRGEDDEHEW